jgi:hypothetical protein
MDVTVAGRVQRASFGELQERATLVVGVNWALVGPLGGFSVSRELKPGDVKGSAGALGQEVLLNPPNVVFGRVRMGDLFADIHFHFKRLVGGHRIRTIDDRDVLFGLPVRAAGRSCGAGMEAPAPPCLRQRYFPTDRRASV